MWTEVLDGVIVYAVVMPFEIFLRWEPFIALLTSFRADVVLLMAAWGDEPRRKYTRNWDTDRRSHWRENVFLHDFCPRS